LAGKSLLSKGEEMHDLAKTAKLCLACGFCCQGLISGRAALQSDEIARAVKYGLPYFTIQKCDYGFSLPCRLYQNGRCQIYSNRPRACRRYECRLQKRLAAGDIELEKCLAIVDQANDLKDSINRKISNSKNTRNFRQVVNRLLDLNCRNPMTFEESAGDILKEIDSFFGVLQQHFEHRAV
jgi:Fe-S-cluster containining protein